LEKENEYTNLCSDKEGETEEEWSRKEGDGGVKLGKLKGRSKAKKIEDNERETDKLTF
jgi:hypothetical protein